MTASRNSNPASRSSHLLSFLWLVMLLCLTLAALIGGLGTEPPTNGILVALSAVSLLCWIYLTIRVFGFRSRLFKFLRLLLSGDYDAGMRTRRRFTDEVSRMEELGNKLAEQLSTYDRLRAERVSIHARVLDLILRYTNDRLITADSEKETFVLNPAAQKLLGITRKSFSFEAILKPKINETFAGLFHQAVSGRKINTEGTCFLQLPGMSAPVRLRMLLMPLRDRNESVRYTLLSIDDKTPDVS